MPAVTSSRRNREITWCLGRPSRRPISDHGYSEWRMTSVPTSSQCGGQSMPKRISAAAASFRLRPEASRVRRSLAACRAAREFSASPLPVALIVAHLWPEISGFPRYAALPSWAWPLPRSPVAKTPWGLVLVRQLVSGQGAAYCRRMRQTMPLFPLGTVLYPGLVLPLHIFEERYRQLVRDLQAEPEPQHFGVIAIRKGRETGVDGVTALFETGCTAVVRRVTRHPDGKFDPITVGAERFK